MEQFESISEISWDFHDSARIHNMKVFVNFTFSSSTFVLSWLFLHQSPFSVSPSLLSSFSSFHLSRLAFLQFLSLFILFFSCLYISSYISLHPFSTYLTSPPVSTRQTLGTVSHAVLISTFLLSLYSDTYVAFLRIFLRSTHGDIGKILDNFLRIFCFTGSTFTSVMRNNIILKLFIFLSNDST